MRNDGTDRNGCQRYGAKLSAADGEREHKQAKSGHNRQDTIKQKSHRFCATIPTSYLCCQNPGQIQAYTATETTP